MTTKPLLLRIVGAVLLLFASVVAFLWFFWLAPVRHLASGLWVSEHSASRQWEELQKALKHRTWILHESGLDLGKWGDEEWAAWLIAEFRAGRNHLECADGHLDLALPYITNQELGYDANAWVAWWTTNSAKTQAAWIQDGFRKQGIELSRTLEPSNIIALLKLLVPPPKTTNNVAITNRPSASLRYNAFRWLRDSGFDPSQFELESLPPDEKTVVTGGLINYLRYLAAYIDNPGKVMGEENDYEADDKWFLIARFQPVLAAILLLLAFCGWRLLRHHPPK